MSLTENLDAMEAVQHIPIEDRDALKYALAATMVAGMKFIAGEPMKPATNRLSGCS